MWRNSASGWVCVISAQILDSRTPVNLRKVERKADPKRHRDRFIALHACTVGWDELSHHVGYLY